MDVREYDNILYRDLMAKLEGFKDRLDYEESIYRKIAQSAFIGPHLKGATASKTFEEFWPGKKKGDHKKVTNERRRAIKEALKQMNSGKV